MSDAGNHLHPKVGNMARLTCATILGGKLRKFQCIFPPLPSLFIKSKYIYIDETAKRNQQSKHENKIISNIFSLYTFQLCLFIDGKKRTLSIVVYSFSQLIWIKFLVKSQKPINQTQVLKSYILHTHTHIYMIKFNKINVPN